MRYRITALFVLWMLHIGSVCRPVIAADLRTFRDDERQTIDRRVLAEPDRRTEEPQEAFYGWITGLSVARTPLSAQEERRTRGSGASKDSGFAENLAGPRTGSESDQSLDPAFAGGRISSIR